MSKLHFRHFGLHSKILKGCMWIITCTNITGFGWFWWKGRLQSLSEPVLHHAFLLSMALAVQKFQTYVPRKWGSCTTASIYPLWAWMQGRNLRNDGCHEMPRNMRCKCTLEPAKLHEHLHQVRFCHRLLHRSAMVS